MQVTGTYELHKYFLDIFFSFLHARACIVKYYTHFCAYSEMNIQLLTLGQALIILLLYSHCRIANLEEEHGGTIEREFS